MPGLVPGIHAFRAMKQDVDGRDKPGHDRWMGLLVNPFAVALCFRLCYKPRSYSRLPLWI
jgi:hypothetical protein